MNIVPRQLQNRIHTDFSTGLAAWEAYRAEITGVYPAGGSLADYSNHLLREFNRKVDEFGHTGLFFNPKDAGFRYIGDETGVV
jgi:hypothetical protein